MSKLKDFIIHKLGGYTHIKTVDFKSRISQPYELRYSISGNKENHEDYFKREISRLLAKDIIDKNLIRLVRCDNFYEDRITFEGYLNVLLPEVEVNNGKINQS